MTAAVHHGPRLRTATLAALALLSAVAPFSIDLYLPAFPAMVSDLATTATGVQLSLTAFLVGAGVGQIVFGPLSDRKGRYGPLLVGVGLYVAASLVATLAPSIQVLVGARLVQGIAGAAGMVIGRAIILDVARGPEAARALNVMMLIGGIAPVAAPLAGSLLADAIGWRGLLGIVAGLGVLALLGTVLFVRETRPRAVREAESTLRGARGGLGALRSRQFLGYTAAFAFAQATMMAYISASPFVYQRMMGLSTQQFGLSFAANALGLVLMTAVSARLTRRFAVARLTAAGLVANLVAIVVITVFALGGAPAIWLIVPIFVAVAALGLVFGNATALALNAVPAESTGTASAVLGVLQFALAGLVAALVGIAGENTAVPLALTMLVASVLALTGGVVAGFGRQRSAVSASRGASAAS